jgi:hypothetical protein
VRGAAGQEREIDLGAVEQVQPHARIERGGQREHGLADRLARARLPADEHVALHQRDRDRLAVLVDPNRDRQPRGELGGVGVGPAPRLGGLQRVAADDLHSGQAGVVADAVDADLADAQERGDRLGLLLDLGDGFAGRDPDQEPVAGQREPVADDLGDAVVEVGEVGVPDRERPLASDVGAPRDELDSPADLWYPPRASHAGADQQHRRNAPEDARQEGDDRQQRQRGGDLDPPGPQRPTDQQEQFRRRGHLCCRAQRRRRLVDDGRQPDPSNVVAHQRAVPHMVCFASLAIPATKLVTTVGVNSNSRINTSTRAPRTRIVGPPLEAAEHRSGPHATARPAVGLRSAALGRDRARALLARPSHPPAVRPQRPAHPARTRAAMLTRQHTRERIGGLDDAVLAPLAP